MSNAMLLDIKYIQGCINGQTVYKKISLYEDGCEEIEFVNNAGTVTSGTGWTGGDCASYDYEKTIMCAPNGDKVLVESWSNMLHPTDPRTISATYLVSGLPYTGNREDLVSCGGETYDIQTKTFCDGGENVLGTLVFEVTDSMPALIGIVFNKMNGTSHTPVNPQEGNCNTIIYNEEEIWDVTSTQTFAANTYHSVTYSVISGTTNITIGSTTVTALPSGTNQKIEASELLTNAITITPQASSRVLVLTLK